MNPCVVIPNSCPNSIRAESVVKGILGVDQLCEPTLFLGGDLKGWDWHVDTKYYETEVILSVLGRKTIGNQEFAEAVNAVVLPFDSKMEEGLNVATQWLTFISELAPEVKILLCENCDSGGVSKVRAQNWCVKNGFELVELNPTTVEEDSDVEDDFPESTGIKRVIQALHAHVWPNLVMKGDGRRPPPLTELQHALNGLPISGDNVASNVARPVNGESSRSSDLGDRKKKLIAQVKPLPKEDGSLPSNVAVVSPIVFPAGESSSSSNPVASTSTVASNDANASYAPTTDNPEVVRPSPTRDERLETIFQTMESMPEESFEELFQNLSEMKRKAELLSPTQRRKYAEKIAIAFWKSVSGNDSEVEGLSSSDDEQ